MRFKMQGMDDVSDSPMYELLPVGIYTVRVQSKTDTQSQNKDPMVKVMFEVMDPLEYAGQKLFDNIILSTNPESPGWKIRWKAKQFLKSIGEPYAGESFSGDSDDWIYKKCQVKIKHQKQTEGQNAGEMRAVILQYAPLEGAPISPPQKTVDNPAPAVVVEDDPEIPF